MKVKEALQKQQQKDFEEDLSLAEWLDCLSKEPSDKELNEMGESISQCRFKIYPLNNASYLPLKGA